jgi:2-polyprenyl-6-methoxyphenol hydroxylase-like FAD-dependent oxidoreductase
VKRTNLNLALKEAVLKAGIEIKEGWKLESIGEVPRNDNETGVVVAIAEDGRREEGEFLVGCDGIKSAVRSLVLFSHGLPEGEVEFTGLTQVCSPPFFPPSHPIFSFVFALKYIN